MKFERIAVNKPWAGSRLRSLYPELASELPAGTGESIELADMPGQQTILAHGEHSGLTLTELLKLDRAAILGDADDGLETFPLAVKLLDTSDTLSIQNHPSDVWDGDKLISRGKSECWLILDAGPEAFVYQGLKAGITLADFEKAIAAGNPETILNKRPVKRGDFINNPAGLIHAIGPDVALLEIQQNCPTTYRLFDFPREGSPRELHLEQGLKAAKDWPLPEIQNTEAADIELLKEGPFKVRSLRLDTPQVLSRDWHGFTVLTLVEGEMEITCRAADNLQPIVLKEAATVLIPAAFETFELFPKGDCWLVISSSGQ
ncbi:MAG: class I mannose-6-phosphate isomerase [Planctomycetes bacterium]|nr:class I mannose-6-phosphate isomerase [Planctomycetota bacterium]